MYAATVESWWGCDASVSSKSGSTGFRIREYISIGSRIRLIIFFGSIFPGHPSLFIGMRYLGGKSRVSKKVGTFLNHIIKERRATAYVEPFCGSCWITKEINPAIPRYCSDIHQDLILMWQGLQQGWMPPDELTEPEYQCLRNASPSALRGFGGFGCSFAGKWLGGYARCHTHPRGYCSNAKRSILKKLPHIQDVRFKNCSYAELPPMENFVVYCDPPYSQTTSYSGTGQFDHEAFWQWVRLVSKRNFVFVSEWQAPSDFKTVLTIPTTTCIRPKDGNEPRVEKLFSVSH